MPMAILPDHPDTSLDPEAFQSLLDLIVGKNPNANTDLLRAAFEFAEKSHGGQLRMSGEPYLVHPLEVARIVAQLGMDDESIAAALLHDVIEDTGVTSMQLGAMFGEGVASLVEGVTKLRLNIHPEASARQRAAAETARAAESLRKMLLAMAKDVRVMVIKLADRLHNMRTIDFLPPDRQTRMASETHDIYGPLAARLGIWQIKWQLEDLAFKVLHPTEFHEISEMVAKTRAQRENELAEAMEILHKELEERGLSNLTIQGRPKHLYSIFNKMVQQGVPYEEIYDLLAVRVIAEETPQCYLTLGIVHDLWLPMPGLFYDYIAMPKPNGYQSLHTKVIGPKGEPLEVQIRTKRMHQVAEYGVAAHWAYKEGKEKTESKGKLTQLRQQLFDWSTDSRTSSDFLRTVSTDLFSEQVFVFTPKGDVLDLPVDSTPIDFAFRVHSELGLLVVGSRVNGVMVPLSTKLQNGDVVELITRSNAQPSLDWLEFVKSQHARSKIRAYFRKRNRAENAQRGREALDKELRSFGLDPKLYLGEEKLEAAGKQLKDCESAMDLLAKVGEGLLSVVRVVDKLRGLVHESRPEPFSKLKGRTQTTLISSGIDNVMLKRAKCCMPIPDEEVVGYVTRGRGIMIHRKVCPNAIRFAEVEPERLVAMKWPTDGTSYPVNLSVVCLNRQGLLMDISTVFGEAKANVSAARVRTLPNHTAEIDVTIEVVDLKQMQSIMTKVGNLSDVISILRVFGRTASR